MLNCMIITAAYRSSLIAHLTVQKKFPPINTFEDLLERKGWRWGRMPSSGTSFTFFNKSSDPVVNGVFMNIEVKIVGWETKKEKRKLFFWDINTVVIYEEYTDDESALEGLVRCLIEFRRNVRFIEISVFTISVSWSRRKYETGIERRIFLPNQQILRERHHQHLLHQQSRLHTHSLEH